MARPSLCTLGTAKAPDASAMASIKRVPLRMRVRSDGGVMLFLAAPLTDELDVEILRRRYQLAGNGSTPKPVPQGRVRSPNYNSRDCVFTGEVDESFDHVGGFEPHGFCP